MRKTIKKILKEEDFDWADGDPKDHYNQEESFVRWLDENHKGWRIGNRFDEVSTINGYLSSDANEMKLYAEVLEDENQDMETRLRALNDYESYASVGHLIENQRLYFKWFVEYAKMSGLKEYDIQELANGIINKGLHRQI
jgi:hypothetical protein